MNETLVREAFTKLEHYRNNLTENEQIDQEEHIKLINWLYRKLGVAIEALPEQNLKINMATYGSIINTINVKEILEQNIQDDDTLEIDVSNKTMGRDPAPGARKNLVVNYTLNNEEKTIEVKENKKLVLGANDEEV
jgi:hypothetical protein